MLSFLIIVCFRRAHDHVVTARSRRHDRQHAADLARTNNNRRRVITHLQLQGAY